jgi:hypothetical protein
MGRRPVSPFTRQGRQTLGQREIAASRQIGH